MPKVEKQMPMDDQHVGNCCPADGGSCGYSVYYPRSKHFLNIVLGIFILVLGICALTQFGDNGWYKNIKAEITSQPYARTITVSGEGKITAKPDLAMISLSVASAGKTVKEVTDDNNTKMNQIIGEIKKLKVEDKDIMTSDYNLYPQYENIVYPIYSTPAAGEQKPPKILGYNLTQTISVKVRDLGSVDQVLDVATVNGANQIGSLSFDIDDSSKIKQEAREKAFQAARDKAEAMVKSAGVKLGRVVTFSEGYQDYPVSYRNFAVESKAMDVANIVAPQVQAGSKELNINVSITYEIE